MFRVSLSDDFLKIKTDKIKLWLCVIVHSNKTKNVKFFFGRKEFKFIRKHEIGDPNFLYVVRFPSLILLALSGSHPQSDDRYVISEVVEQFIYGYPWRLEDGTISRNTTWPAQGWVWIFVQLLSVLLICCYHQQLD
jgi:hypothetical protein